MRPPLHWIKEECVVVHREQTGPPDEFGSPTWVETSTADLIFTWPLNADEVLDRPAGRISHGGAVRPSSVISHSDRVEKATGQNFEVDGPALVWRQPDTLEVIGQTVQLIEVV